MVTPQDILLQVSSLKKYFPVTRGLVFRRTIAVKRAVDGVSFDIKAGESLCLVGESGSGKTTTANLVLRIIDATEGKIAFQGADISELKEESLKDYRKNVAAIFQDPFTSLDPRMNVARIVAEPLDVHRLGDRASRRKRVKELLVKVGLREEDAQKYPHQFSGGQRQRIAIARALALSPLLIVADEPLSALDVSLQATIINLLKDLQEELNLSYLFITHDLSVVRHIAHRIAVMYLGRIVECGKTEQVFQQPRHPYTKGLLSSIPVLGKRFDWERNTYALRGEIPSLVRLPSGCRFSSRCPFVNDCCRSVEPQLTGDVDHMAACHYWEELSEST